ncbi:putative LRR receptor-like serine/threonine-protein kinase RFK1 [Glycine soja]|nr:putative LRR receptor-like serine/threonine-protein kinase RFK1 [Glycine max]
MCWSLFYHYKCHESDAQHKDLMIFLFSLPDSKPCSDQKNARHKIIVGVGFGVTALCLVFIIVGIFWWKGYFKRIIRTIKGTERQDSQKGIFTLKQIRDATYDFTPDNMIGEGGFGHVYKGQLSDGTLIAVKQLSSKSRQGNREFLNEIGMISCLHHLNLVKLHGCCMERDQLILVYEYMESNSLARALFSEFLPKVQTIVFVFYLVI